MQAVIFTGVQGSGKTTFYNERFRATHAHISLDVVKTRPRERALLAACLREGRPFVVDNTNGVAAARAPYIAAAHAAGFRVTGYFFEIPLAEALRRNARRAGPARIPAPGVIGTFRRIEPPVLAEGFDELFTVTSTADGTFLVAGRTA